MTPATTHSMQITFRDLEHFHKVIKWMNSNVGFSSKVWTITGSVKKKLERGKPVKKTVNVFVEDFDPETSSLFLNLM